MSYPSEAERQLGDFLGFDYPIQQPISSRKSHLIWNDYELLEHYYNYDFPKYWEKKNGTKKATFNDILTSAISYYGLEGYENDYYIIETPLKQIVKNS